MIDSYQLFLDKFGMDKDEFFKWGLSEIRWAPPEEAEAQWKELKARIQARQEVFVRNPNDRHKALYKKLFGEAEHIKKDGNGNRAPLANLEKVTGKTRNTHLFNFQVSHVFGGTKNPYLFEATWNIAFVPKIMDPMTGHETKGVWPEEFSKYFKAQAYRNYKTLIDDYDRIAEKHWYNVEEYLVELGNENFKKNKKFIELVRGDFKPIGKIDTSELDEFLDGTSSQPADSTRHEDEKIGRVVQRFFGSHQDLSEDVLRVLQSTEQSREILGIRFPILKTVGPDGGSKEDRKVDGYVRYWKNPYKINGKTFLVTNDWYKRHKEKFTQWANQIR